MVIKNNTNGKEIPISKEKWQALTRKQKSNFTVISENDSDTDVQIVENKAAPKEKQVAVKKTESKEKNPPDSGEKKK